MSGKHGFGVDDQIFLLLQGAIEKVQSLKVVNDFETLGGLLEDLEKLKSVLHASQNYDESAVSKLVYPVYLELLRYVINHFF